MRILAPFRHRDFALYWIARSTSWVGDGVMVVALPWQVYELTNSPTAMGIVGAAQMVPRSSGVSPPASRACSRSRATSSSGTSA